MLLWVLWPKHSDLRHESFSLKTNIMIKNAVYCTTNSGDSYRKQFHGEEVMHVSYHTIAVFLNVPRLSDRGTRGGKWNTGLLPGSPLVSPNTNIFVSESPAQRTLTSCGPFQISGRTIILTSQQKQWESYKMLQQNLSIPSATAQRQLFHSDAKQIELIPISRHRIGTWSHKFVVYAPWYIQVIIAFQVRTSFLTYIEDTRTS